MKFSAKLFYPAFLLILIVGVVLVTQFEKDKASTPLSELTEKQIPNDDVHKGMGNPNSPSGANVNESFKQQLESLKNKVESNPNDTLSMREYADLLTESHKAKDAIPYYEKILKVNPKRSDVLFNLSIIAFNGGELKKAEDYTKQILSFEKNNDQALYNLGAIEAAKGDRNKAKQLWEDIIKKFPGTPTAELAKSSIERL